MESPPLYIVIPSLTRYTLYSARLSPSALKTGSSARVLKMDAMGAEEFVNLLNVYVAVRYTNVATLMLLIYDYFLTLEHEVSRIWTLPWRLPKILFLINRYITPPMLIFDGLTLSHIIQHLRYIWENTCNFVAKWTAWPTLLSIGTVDVILILRVLSIYGHGKKITRFVVSTFLCTFIAWLGISIPVSYKTTSVPGGDLFTGCLFTAPTYFYAAWIPPVVFESVIIALTLYQVFRYNSMTPTLRVLTRDSIIYFTLIFIILTANLFIARYGKGFIGALLIVPCSAVACIAASRMTMNVREFTMSDPPESSGIELAAISFRPGDASTPPTTPGQSSGHSAPTPQEV